MSQTIVLRGHVAGERLIKVDSPIPSEVIRVEVVLHLPAPRQGMTLGQYLRSLPPGTRTAEDIRQQIEEERNSWNDE